MPKSDYMLAILWLLRSGKKRTAQQLADELEIHVRTVYRCIDALCASGVPIVAEPGHHGGYRVLEQFSEAPLSFHVDEQKALLHAATFAREAGYPFTDALNGALEKLRWYANEEQAAYVGRHAEQLSVIHPPMGGKLKLLLQLLEQAAADGRTVSFTYKKEGAAAPEERGLDPYGIVFWKGCWYVVGRCRLRCELRSFRVDRMVEAVLTESSFDRPEGFSAKQFLMGSMYGDALQGEEKLDVVIEGAESALNELCLHWLFGHALHARTPERAVFRIGLQSVLSFVPYFLLPYGRALTTVEPTLLLQRMAEVTDEMATHYRAMYNRKQGEIDRGKV